MRDDEVRRTVAEHWDDRSPVFDDEPDHGLDDPRVRAAWSENLLMWLPAPPADVVDLGCGTGTLSILLAARGYRVTGVDVSPRMLERARDKAARAGVDVAFGLGDAADPGMVAASIDVALVRHLVWTLTEPVAALQAWVRLLRPGGRIVLIEGRWATPDGSDDGRYAAIRHAIPWHSGVSADTLAAELAPLVDSIEIHDLSGEDALWNRAVNDERYAIIGHTAV